MKQPLVLVLVVLAVVLTPTAAIGGSAPPDATALCKDGTYSYSQTRSGTCSHHGGVAEWLTASATTTTTASTTTVVSPPPTTTSALPATTTTAAPATTTQPTINLGKTVLLKARTKTFGCTLGPLPDRHCSPGAYYSGLTKAVICSASFRTSSVRNVPDSEKHQVEIEYGLAAKGYRSTLEIDHIVSLELGGSNDAANLFPEKSTFAAHLPGFHIKDKLENKVHELVCAGQMALSAARTQVASNWEALYKRVYRLAPTG